MKQIVSLVIISTAFVVTLLLHTHQVFIIRSGSMEPTLLTGSLIFVPKTTPPSYAVNDIITFHSRSGIMTHRIIHITNESALAHYQTKGDANPNPDQTLVTPDQIIGRAALTIPYLGYLALWLKTKLGFTILILMPATFVILQEVQTIVTAWQHLRWHRRVLIIMAACIITESIAQASFSTTATIASTNITIADRATSPPPTPLPSHDECDIVITTHAHNKNTGPHSTNKNVLIVNAPCTTLEAVY